MLMSIIIYIMYTTQFTSTTLIHFDSLCSVEIYIETCAQRMHADGGPEFSSPACMDFRKSPSEMYTCIDEDLLLQTDDYLATTSSGPDTDVLSTTAYSSPSRPGFHTWQWRNGATQLRRTCQPGSTCHSPPFIYNNNNNDPPTSPAAEETPEPQTKHFIGTCMA